MPCPIVEAVLDIRFETVVPPDAVVGVVYQALHAFFPKTEPLPISMVPAEMRRSDPALALQPLLRMEGEHLAVLVGAQSLAVGIRGAYPGWATLAPRFHETLTQAAASGLIAKPTRFGLRYINFYPGDIFPKLTLSVTVGGEPASGEGTFFKTVLAGDGCQLLLQVGKGLDLVNEPGKTGSVIDIDAFMMAPDTTEGFDAALAAFLNRAHAAEKQLFFSLLKSDFLQTLQPTYADAG